MLGQFSVKFMNSWGKLVTKPIYIATASGLTMGVYLLYTFVAPLFAVWFVTTLLWVMPIALLLQTFMFLYKTYRVSKYTNANQKFWKRSLFIFWTLELFLFLIVVFLWFNSPENTKPGVNHMGFFRESRLVEWNYVEGFVLPLGLVILSNRLIFLKKNNNGLQLTLGLVLQMVLLTYLLISEFHQLMSVYSRTSMLEVSIKNTLNNGGLLSENWVVESKWQEDLVTNHFKMLMIFLKFWHILFITIFFTFHAVRYIEYRTLSFDTLGASTYNMSFLMWFNILFMFVYKKKVFYRLLVTPNRNYVFVNEFLPGSFAESMVVYLGEIVR